ncbi:hypothetical protein E2562_022059 [Oryza meyeriana var. granulata]|uniref:RING-type E3 ubiquitin transferase n=1 Tax=Oryza meyeriana var. granulata TaxID=110450 RepID=A0A6G1ENL4_9ORYZ|nr:hypothetical protein E2562_022059 [Oryza meyeriana var. granulata]
MAPPRGDPNPNPLLLVVLLLIPATAVAASTYSDHCHGLPSAPDLAVGGGEGADWAPLLRSLQLPTGYFSGGGTWLFGPDSSLPPRSFSFLPSSFLRTTDASLLHVSATLTVSGGRSRPPFGGRHLFEYDGQAHRFRPRLPRFVGRRGSVTFGLEGYYSSASGELCMVGTGSGRAADGTAVNLLSAVLHVHYPSCANLTRPFVTGSLESTDSPRFFEPVSLVAYAEEGYAYAESASCPPPPTGRLDALQVFEGRKFSCAHLSSLFKAPFRLDYSNSSESTASSLGIHQMLMFVNRMRCADDGAVRAYVVFSNQTDASAYYFMLGEKAMVVEGFWDEKRSRLCLKGCHVVNSGPSPADLAVGECGIGMSFWFPAVWSLQERSFSAGLYNYTKVDEARKYYEKYGLNKKRKVAQHVKGTIRSLRKKTDPLFFEPLDIASYGLYIDRVDESIWRMDLESTMALISMTLSCLFIAVQLFHVKKVPEALPAMSITMLVVLSLGYMIPLVLNFEALFKNSNKQTVPLSGGGWLEVNEVMRQPR